LAAIHFSISYSGPARHSRTSSLTSSDGGLSGGLAICVCGSGVKHSTPRSRQRTWRQHEIGWEGVGRHSRNLPESALRRPLISRDSFASLTVPLAGSQPANHLERRSSSTAASSCLRSPNHRPSVGHGNGTTRSCGRTQSASLVCSFIWLHRSKSWKQGRL
jgi:hypothetical protein